MSIEQWRRFLEMTGVDWRNIRCLSNDDPSDVKRILKAAGVDVDLVERSMRRIEEATKPLTEEEISQAKEDWDDALGAQARGELIGLPQLDAAEREQLLDNVLRQVNAFRETLERISDMLKNNKS